MGKTICEQQTQPATPAGGKTTLTHLLGSPSSTAWPPKSSPSSSLTQMVRCPWFLLPETVIVISQGKGAAHGCQVGWDCTTPEHLLLQEALERFSIVGWWLLWDYVASWCSLAATSCKMPSAKTVWNLYLLYTLRKKIYQHVARVILIIWNLISSGASALPWSKQIGLV